MVSQIELRRLVWVALFCLLAPATASPHDRAVDQLRAIETRIQRVAAEALPACVAVSDGVGFGSGVVVSSSGLILTAGHVVHGGKQEFDVYFPDGRIVRARLLGYHLDVDAGMLQIKNAGTWPSVPVASDSQHLQPGDWLVSLGHSGGYEVGRKPPVRTGRLLERRDHLLVTDAVLIGGDSGGPLFDLEGRVVAIHSSIGDTIAENRHVAIDVFQRDWKQMQAGKRWGTLPDLSLPAPPAESPSTNRSGDRVSLPLLGVDVKTLGRQVIVERVLSGSPAARVGIKVGDILESFDGRPLSSAATAQTLVQSKRAGESATVRILRNGRLLTLQIILDRLK